MSTLVWSSLKSWDGKVSEQDFNRLVDALQSITINPGLNYTIARTPAGTTILPGGKGGGSGSTCPFTVSINAISGDPDNVSIKISPGTVNAFIPSNVFDSFTIASTGTFYVKVGVETDGQNVTACTFYVDDSEPDPQNAAASSLPTSFDITLALIKDAKAYRTIGCGSLMLTSSQAFITDKASPAGPGELTYIPYYVWQWGIA